MYTYMYILFFLFYYTKWLFFWNITNHTEASLNIITTFKHYYHLDHLTTIETYKI